MNPLRTYSAAAILVLAAASAAVDTAYAEEEQVPRRDAARLMMELMTGRGPIGGAFELSNADGRRVGTADWRGKFVLLYFGYTFCPDACPTELNSIAEAIHLLGPAGEEVQPVFVTIDPERDRPKMIERYAQSFHPRFVALHGSESETRRVATAYKVFYQTVRRPGTDVYLIDHTSFIYMLDATGQFAGYFPTGTSGRRIAEQVAPLLGPSPVRPGSGRKH